MHMLLPVVLLLLAKFPVHSPDYLRTENPTAWLQSLCQSEILAFFPVFPALLPTHDNFQYVLKGTYNGKEYTTDVALRVGWTSEVSPFNKTFDKTFLKRVRAYDNNGKDFDITYVFNNLKNNKYISDGDKDTVVIPTSMENKLGNTTKEVIKY